MYDLATLSHRYDYAGISTQNPDEYEKWNKNAIEDFQRDPFLASNNAKAKEDPSPSPYTKDIMELIERCMKPSAKDRIKAREVKTMTEKMLARYGSGDGLQMNEKVYFVGNEINQMQAGSEDFEIHEGPRENTLRRTSVSEINEIMDYSVDPNEPALQPPRWPMQVRAYKMTKKKERAGSYNKYWEKNCRIANGKIIFRSESVAAAGSGPTSPRDNDHDEPNDNGADADDESADQGPSTASKPNALSKKAAGKKPAAGNGGVKKGSKSVTKPTKASTGAGIKKPAAAKPAASKPAATKPTATKPTAKKPAAQATTQATTQATAATSNVAPQAQANPPRRERLARAAKKDVSGQYKA